MKIKQVLIALDQLANALVGGWADETISSRAYREDRQRLMRTIDALFFWEHKHCYRSYLSERERLQMAPEFRAGISAGGK